MRAGVRLERSVHRLGLAVARRAPRSLRVPRLLSVVVPVRDAGTEVDECLASVRQQDHRWCEIVVVDLGLGPSGADVVARHAREDFRVRVVGASGGLANGRNRGAAVAVGEFLAFVDADDAVTRHGFAMTVEALRGSGSDVAVVAHRMARRGHTFPVSDRMQALHSTRRLHTSVDAFPDLLANTVTGARVFRRRTYADRGWAFLDLACPDDAHSVVSYLGAAGVDVLTHVGLLRRAESDRSPLTRRTTDADGLRAFGAGVDAAASLLPHRGSAVYAAEVLAGAAEAFLDRAWRCSDEYWTTLREVVGALRRTAADEARPRVPAYRKVVSGLVMAGDRERVRAFLTGVRPTVRRYATAVERRGDRSVVVADFGQDWADLPVDDRVLAEREVGVRGEVTDVRVADTGAVELTGWAFLDNVDLTDRSPSLRLWLHSGASDVELAVSRIPSPAADVASGLWFSDVSAAGFVARLEPRKLPSSGVWQLVAEVAVDGLVSAARVAIRPWTMAGAAAWVDERGRMLVVDHDDAGRFELRAETSARSVIGLQVAGDTLTVDLPDGVSELRLEPPAGGPVFRRRAVERGRAELSLAHLGTARYAVVGLDRSGRSHPLLRPARVDWHDARVRADRRGGLQVTAYARAAEVISVELREESLVARLSLPPAVAGWETALVMGGTVVTGVLEVGDDGRSEARYSLVQAVWGRPSLPLRSGQYAVSVRNAELSEWVAARPAPGLTTTLPVEQTQDRMRLRVEAFAPDDPAVRLVVTAPLADDELGQRQQRLLREAARVEVADRDAVLFRAMFSESANGNGLGLHEELVRRGSSLELLWSVADRSVPLPSGGVGLIERSRAWHEGLARARYVVVDVHQPEWFVRPHGQALVQTFHGYPYKLMGHDWWEKMGNSVQEIGSLDRRTREWSVLVSPAPYATPLLERAFLEPAGADVRVVETGYPRNDLLLSPRATSIRAEARELLGLADDAVAVLYAPTFRDYLSPEDRTARAVDFLDADELLAHLPHDYVLLLRGHAFNARIRCDRVRSTSRLIDVTDHPDVNDLILASDAAVLDYSSIRFDYVLSGHPMVFLVPDLAEYDRTRGGVVPYAPTAPGPHLASTGEVVAWLSDLPRLTAEFEGARERFRRDFVSLEDGHSAARLLDAVFAPRGDA